MGTEIEKPMTFEDKIMERVKENIGDLIDPEGLKRVVERGINQALFERKPSPRGYGYDAQPSLVEKIVEKHLR